MDLSYFILLVTTFRFVSAKVLCSLDKSDTAQTQFYGRVDTSMSFPVWESQNLTQFDCARYCRSKLTCLAYSYSSYLQECLMFQHDSETTPEYLKDENGYVFYDMVNRDTKRRDYTGVCKNLNHICLNGGSCRNDCSRQGFHCVCAEGFRGEFCEETFDHDLILVDSLLIPASRGTTLFTFNNDLYLFAGGFYDSDPDTVEAPTSVFKFNNVTDRFEPFQELSNTGVTLKLSNFVLMGKQYVFVSTYQTFGGSRVTQSHLFVYENETASFEIHQTFTTYGVWGAYTLRTTGGDFFMFLSNHNGNSFNENSEIYRWHPRYEKFFKVQDIATYGVCSSQMFELDGEVYLALPFYYSATSGYSASSQLWKQTSTYDNYMGCFEDQSTRAMSGDTYSDSSGMTIQTCIDFCRELDYPYAGLQAGSSCFCGDDNYDTYNVKSDGECSSTCSGNGGFYCGGSWRNSVYSVSPSWSLVQDLPDTDSVGTTGALYFNHSGVDYLVMVNHHDGSSCTQHTIIYAWSSEDGQFEVHQKLSIMYCAIDAQIFKRGGKIFMVTSNLRQAPSVSSTDEYQINNTVYIFEGTKFIEYKTVEGIDVWDWQMYEKDNDLFLVQSMRHNMEGTYSNTTLNIYKWI